MKLPPFIAALWVAGLTLVQFVGLTAATYAEACRLVRLDTQGVLRWEDTGEEVALFGVNYYTPFWHNYPDLKAVGADHRRVIDQDVAHFARMGLEALRLHVFDREVSDRDGNLLDNEHLQLLDYLIARAKERGLYTLLTPIAWWPVPGDSPGFSSLFTMPQMTTDLAARKPQRNYLTQFVGHTNRFTGLSYQDDPAVVAFELINEPLYPPDTTDKQITDYINALADAVRATGCRKAIFYNGWGGHLAAVREARVEGSSFGWYPSGLVAGRSLRKNFLPVVDEYGGSDFWNPSMRSAALGPKAKIVYEFDAADIPGSFMYPAMARAFRSGGAQIATQFQYDPLPLAPFNQGWQTHYLNLVFAPQKAVSFLIAAEAFRRLPRLQDYGRYPQSARFGPFRVSYEEDLSEMVTEREFFHSNSTRTAPPAPDKLERVIGCGSSPVVRYEGTGAHFLEKLASRLWRLEVYPDAVWVNDPYGPNRLDREVSRLIWRECPMTIRLKDLGTDFQVEPLNADNRFHAEAKDAQFPVRAGVYLLRPRGTNGAGLSKLKLPAAVGLREFIVPPAQDAPAAVRHEPRSPWVEGRSLPVWFTVATPQEPEEVSLKLRSADPDETRVLRLVRAQAYHYTGVLPGHWLKPGRLSYTLTVRVGGSTQTLPTNAPGAWEVTLLASNAPVALFDADRHQVRVQGDMPHRQSLVEGMTAGKRAMRIATDRFGQPPSCLSFRTDLTEELEPWRDRLADCGTLRLRLRGIEPSTTAVEVVVTERDGTPWGTNVPLTTNWREVRVPLASMRHWKHWAGSPPGRGGPDDRLRARELVGVSVTYGAWLYPAHASEPHTLEVDSIAVE